MERWIGKVAIVTGASAGIGEATVEALVKAGMKVVGLARRVERVKALALKLKMEKGSLYAVQCDLTKEDDILKAFKFVEQELGGPDVLVNNAGVAFFESIIDGSTENFRKIFDVNVIAVAISMREAVQSMRKRKVSGHIININSIAGHNAEIIRMPMSVYPASKYAVTAMSTTMRNELTAAKLDIKITSISPGLVKTEIVSRAGGSDDLFNQHSYVESKDIADGVVYVLETPPGVQVNELTITPLKKSIGLLR